MNHSASRLTSVRCANALTPSGWQKNCVVQFSDQGRIESVREDETSDVDLYLEGIVIAGIPNLHSHAHQKAITGLTEHRVPGQDDFWGWRELMYRANSRLNPEQLQIIANYLYIDMLLKGYTSVAEFHYLHHQPDGTPYSNRSEMSERLFDAASEAGIAITLLPTLYCRGGFENEPIKDAQNRFYHDPDGYLRLLSECHSLCAKDPDRSIGIAAHSLRAVSPQNLNATITHAKSILKDVPIHIHVAEQIKEVNDCMSVNSARPVSWLFDQCDVTHQWCLIHATHVDREEQALIARSGVTVGLCPATEANLGDGIFPASELIANNGFFGIGSDSQVSTSPAHELQLLEYGQRLSRQKRAVLVTDVTKSNGRSLLDAAVIGGNRAQGEFVCGIQPGSRGDLVELNSDHVEFSNRTLDQILDTWIFSGPFNPVKTVIVGAKQVVQNGLHPNREAATTAYRKMIQSLALTET